MMSSSTYLDQLEVAYHEGAPLVSDEEYDLLKEQHELQYGRRAKIGAPAARACALPYHMGSMNKPDAAGLARFVDSKRKLVLSKLDGISALAVLTKGAIKLYTRGDGTRGTDISHLVPLVNFGPTAGWVAVRGELVMSRAAFAAHFPDATNARNLVAGFVNAREPNLAVAPHVDFVVYEVLEPRARFSKGLRDMRALGFQVAEPQSHVNRPDQLPGALALHKEQCRYQIDGIVLVSDGKKHALNAEGNPSFAVAYKGVAAKFLTEVECVEWEVSRHGLLKPTAVFAAVEMPDCTVRRATAHNARFVERNGIGPGARIFVQRSGDTIPCIHSVERRAEPQMPDDFVWNEARVEALQPSATDKQKAKRLHFFFSTVGVKGLGLKNVEKMVEHKYDSIELIRGMGPADYEAAHASASVNGKPMAVAIEDALMHVKIDALMVASGCFGPGFGKAKIRAIVYGGFDMEDNPIEYIASLPGLSREAARLFLVGFESFKRFVDEHNFWHVVSAFDVENRVVTYKVVFSGFRDAQLQSEIEADQGEVVNTVSSDVRFVFASDPTSTASKLQKARRHKIPIAARPACWREFLDNNA